MNGTNGMTEVLLMFVMGWPFLALWYMIPLWVILFFKNNKLSNRLHDLHCANVITAADVDETYSAERVSYWKPIKHFFVGWGLLIGLLVLSASGA